MIQCGKNRQLIFFAEKDYRFFLDCLPQAKLKCVGRIYAYVLMLFHLLLKLPLAGDLVDRFMQGERRRYGISTRPTTDRNLSCGRGFKIAAVSRDDYSVVSGRYIELNPVRAGLINHLRECPWSSYQRRAMGRFDCLLDEGSYYSGLSIDESNIKLA
jgi:REP-associated tyrosine transposase